MNDLSRTYFFLLLAGVAAHRAEAHTPKAGTIHATVSPSFYRTLVDKEEPPPRTWGAGITVLGDVDKNGGVELGLFYLDKTYVRTAGASLLAEKIKRVQITTGYRHWFHRNFSFGGGFFSSYSMGDPKVEKRVGEVPEGFVTSAREITEYGLDFSLQLEVWRGQDWTIVADGRYALSLTDKSFEHADTFMYLVGLKGAIPMRGNRPE